MIKTPENQIQQPPNQEAYQGVFSHEDFFSSFYIEVEANRLIAQRASFDSAPVHEQERQDNARTALMEALTASGFLSRIEITGDSLEDINHQVMSRLLNGWNDDLPEHEKTRRFYEICEELVIQKVQGLILTGALPNDTEVGVLSDAPTLDDMPAAQASAMGYRLKNRKGMVRSTKPFSINENGQFVRVIEQVSRSNSGQATSLPFFDSINFDLDEGKPHDVAGLAKPFIYSRSDYVDGVVDVQRRLDELAGPGIQYGEIIDQTSNSIPYEKLREESARREAEIEHYTLKLALLEEQLEGKVASGEITAADQMSIYKQEVDRILTAICTIHPDYAEDTYGKKASVKFKEASRLVAQGHADQARNVLMEAHLLKEKVLFCGVEISADEAKAMGLEVNSFGELIEEGKTNWKWKSGVCQVETCFSRPGTTLVGPCSVCKDCQHAFDKGRDPTKVSLISAFFMKVSGVRGRDK